MTRSKRAVWCPAPDVPQVTATCGWKRECSGEAWLSSVGGAEFLFVFEQERGRTHFLGFCLLLGAKKKAEGERFLAQRSASYPVVQVGKVQELEGPVRLSFPRWRGMGGLVVQMDRRKILTWVGARWSLCIFSGEPVKMAQWNMKTEMLLWSSIGDEDICLRQERFKSILYWWSICKYICIIIAISSWLAKCFIQSLLTEKIAYW